MLLKLAQAISLLFFVTLLPASYAQTGIDPQLGVNGTPTKSDVQRPSKKNPCGENVDISNKLLDTSTSVPIDNGEVTVTVINFDAYVFVYVFNRNA